MTDPQSLAIAAELETQRAWALTRAAQAAGRIGALEAELAAEKAKPTPAPGYPCGEGAIIIEEDADGYIVDIAGGAGVTRCFDWAELVACLRQTLGNRPTREDGA